MKHVLTYCFILMALTGCKKDNGPTPTSTDTYAGEYSVNGADTFTKDGQESVSQISPTLYVFKSNTPNRYYIFERYTTTESGYFVDVTGNTFKLETRTASVDIGKDQYIGYQEGTGRFEGKNIYIEKTIGPYVLRYDGYSTPYKMTRKVVIHATPK